MVCPACGLNSLDPNVCDWCQKPIPPARPSPPLGLGNPMPPPNPPGPLYSAPMNAAAGAARPAPLDLTQPVPTPLDQTQPVNYGQSGGNVRMSLTGEILEVAPPTPRFPQGQSAPPPIRPQPGPIPPRSQPYPAGSRGMSRDLPTAVVDPRFINAPARYDDVPPGEKVEKCLAMLFPLLLLGVLGVRFLPTAYLWIDLGVLFLAALVMGGTGAIGSYDEAFAECTGVLVVSYFLGPLVGFGGFLLLCLIRQEMSPIVPLMLVHIAARFMLILSAGSVQGLALYEPDGDFAMLLPHISIFSAPGFISFFIVCATFAGWMMSSFFRPVNE